MPDLESDLAVLQAAEEEASTAATQDEAREIYLRHGVAPQPAADLAARQFGTFREGVQDLPAAEE